MESVLDFVVGFFSCGFKLFGYLLTVALVGWVLGLFIPLFYFIPTAIAYFFLSFLLLIFSLPLYGCFLRNKAKIKDAPLELTEDDMPVLRPIPTATVHQDGWFNKLLTYMFVPRTWRLMQNWYWTSESPDGTEIELVVPKGFECDAASIPRPYRALFNPTGALLLPALLHDFGFKYNQLWFVDKDGNFMPYYPLEFLPDDKQGVAWDQIAGDEQRNAWDQFLYEIRIALLRVFLRD